MKQLFIGKLMIELADGFPRGAAAIVVKGRLQAVLLPKVGWVTRASDPERWDSALDAVSERVMLGGNSESSRSAEAITVAKPKRKYIRKKGRESHEL